MTKKNLTKTFSLIYFNGDITEENKKEITDKGFALMFLFNDILCNNLLQFNYKKSTFEKNNNEHILNISLEFNNDDAYHNFTDNDINHLVSLVLDNPIDLSETLMNDDYFKFLELKIKDYIFLKDSTDIKSSSTSIKKQKF